ncbi:TonB-dependent receptor [Acinetobacter sp. ME22]|uniref:TonB-dependent siderophore receptor n=1 Tax=Acinetobacter sp. ME22 TaxID=2904802 RepID=UPI001EDA7BAA|nr:TonB-dependent receptor [Acinetobacter sp. ME22]MCG2573340.1 TonB-dependent receptor [Acinetobacter sp. ME22]
MTVFANDQVSTLQTITVQASSPKDRAEKQYKVDSASSATKTNTTLKHTPQAVTVVSKAVLQDIQATRLSEALDVAGIGRANNFGGQGLTTFTSRGFTSGEYYRNGFPINRGYPNAPDSSTIERVEVLKGASSSLYGRGDPGGTFNVVSKTPQAEHKTVLGFNVDNEGLYRSTVDTTGALDDAGTLTYRLNLMGENGDTYRDNVDSKRWNIAPVLQWTPSDQTKVILEADFLRNQHPLDRGFTHYDGQQSYSFDASDYWWESGKDRNRLYNNNDMLQLRVEHELNDAWKLNVGAQYLNGNLHGYAVEANGVKAGSNGAVITRNYNWRNLDWIDKDVQASLVGEFNLWNVEHKLMTGIELEDYDYKSYIIRSTADFDLNINQPYSTQALPALVNVTTHDREQLQSKAIYVQDQIRFTDRFNTLIGLRFEHYDHDYTNLVNSTSWSTEHNAFMPRIGFTYDLTDQLSVYSNISKSFKPNSGADRNNQGFKPEEGISYEIGSKYSILDNKLSFDTALYYVKKKNVLTLDPLDSTKSVAAGEVTSKGLDLSLVGRLTPQWKIIGNYAYTDAAVSKDNTLVKGTRLANIPQNAFNLLSVYEFKSGKLNGLGLGLNQHYVGSRKGQTANSTYTMASYATTDFISYYDYSADIRFSFDIKNIFNKDYDESAFNRYVYPGEPRTAKIGVTYSF